MSKWIKIEVPDEVEVPETVTAGDNFLKVWEPKYQTVLDHGYIGLVDFMGDDASIVNSARVSYGKGTKSVRSDEGLIRYLMRHYHTTPFESVVFKFHVKAPIFVFRQWHRHRTATINEISGRYSEMKDELYVPDQDHCAVQSKDNKQGREKDPMDDQNYKAACVALEQIYSDAFAHYHYLLSGKNPPDALNNRRLFVEDAALQAIRQARQLLAEKNVTEEIAIQRDLDPSVEVSEDDKKRMIRDYYLRHPEQNWTEEQIKEKIQEYYEANELAIFSDDFAGIAKELARMVLPLSTYSEMYWVCNLHNIYHFIRLRSDPHAQYEIRVYSDAMLEMVKEIAPWATQAFLDYRMHAISLSKFEVNVVRKFLDSQRDAFISFVEENMDPKASKRERDEFYKALIP